MNVNEETRKAQSFCVECWESKGLVGGMFWSGSVRGYGEFEVKCLDCGKIIHSVEEDDAESNET
jgi:hypothetical protein